ncbi:toll/interleukin-1 receptor domain-containing protein [Cetobacterium sp.]|uniref:toll/interleukin-1 receptor domain-containing protein n=1 Tax=Cetobacterium sp. TaxID=2071632 RepID=UPI003F2ED190
MSNRKCFISYCWRDEELVNKIDKNFLSQGIQLQRDKRDINSWESIKDFMKEIRECECAILVISSSYLKSINCMYEVLEVMKDENYRDKIITVVLKSANIYNSLKKIKYIKYWQEQHTELERGIREINNFEITSKLGEDLKKIRNIMGNIDEFISIISDMNNPVVDDNICDEIQKKLKEKGIVSNKNNDIDSCNCANSFFDLRLGKAFPGLRGGKWFNTNDGIIDRLALLLQEPLTSKKLSGPIWWFRGSSCLDIKYFEKINSEKCIIEAKECLIDKVYVYKSGSYYRSFIYVELKAEKPVGIYENTPAMLEAQKKYFGHAYEEYAIYKEQAITRAEYDDGAAFINNEYVEFEETPQIRLRYLTKYNFIICSKFNPINSNSGDELTEQVLKSIIEGKSTVVDLENIIERLPKLSKGN